MSAVNKKYILKGPLEFSLETEPIPSPPQGGVVVKTAFAGVCHSDVHFIKPDQKKRDPGFSYPITLGHEISGVVHAVDKDVKTDLKVGDRVLVWPWGQCRQCAYCRSCLATCSQVAGLNPQAKPGENYGWYIDGGYQSYVVVKSPEFLVPVAATLPLDVAAMIPCSGITSYSAVLSLQESVEDAIKMKGAARVAVIGAGGLALWTIQIVKAFFTGKVTVVAVDVLEEKVKDAKEAGADITHCWSRDATTPEAVKNMVTSTGGYFDGIIDFTGIESCIDRAFYSLDQKGTLTIVGLGGNTIPAFSLVVLVARSLRVKGNLVGSLDHCKAVMDLVVSGKVKPPPITHVALEDVEQTIERLGQGKQRGRAIVKHD